jgi:uncharacterized glyoxalase superfamily protein PhnB
MVVSDVRGAVSFLQSVFGAIGELTPDRPAEMQIGDSLVMVSQAGERELFPALLYVYVPDADVAHANALAAGAVAIESPQETPWGDRRGIVQDPYGNVYQIAHRMPG